MIATGLVLSFLSLATARGGPPRSEPARAAEGRTDLGVDVLSRSGDSRSRFEIRNENVRREQAVALAESDGTTAESDLSVESEATGESETKAAGDSTQEGGGAVESETAGESETKAAGDSPHEPAPEPVYPKTQGNAKTHGSATSPVALPDSSQQATGEAQPRMPHPEPFFLPKSATRYRYPGRTVGWKDVLAFAAVQGAYFVVEYTQHGPRRAHLKGTLPGDEFFRNLVVAPRRGLREASDEASDYLWYASIAYPFVATTILPLARGAKITDPLQMSLINMQAFAATSLIVRMPHKWLGRLRPNAVGCEEEGDEYDAQCGSNGQLLSFPSGHTQVAMTGAGLSCAHHLHGHLFDDGVADASACATAILAASAVGYLRMRADRHWMSDTIVGAAVGFGIGYGIPALFYYFPFWQWSKTKPEQHSRVMMLPVVSRGGAGLSAAGVF